MWGVVSRLGDRCGVHYRVHLPHDCIGIACVGKFDLYVLWSLCRGPFERSAAEIGHSDRVAPAPAKGEP